MDHTNGRFMTPAEVAAVFRVSAKTVFRWADKGRLRFIRTPGGHRRYFRSQIEAMADEADR